MGGDCFYNEMPCCFKCCVVSSQPYAPRSHCVHGGGGSANADKCAVNTQAGFGEALGVFCSVLENQTYKVFEKLLLYFISWL